MWQAEVRIDLDAIRSNVRLLRARTRAAFMAVVKADGYGHGLVPAATAAVQGGADWLGVATLTEALQLRAGGLQIPILSWLHAPGVPLAQGIDAGIDLSASSQRQLAEIAAAAVATGRTARLHLKIDTGLSRSGAPVEAWPDLLEATAKAAADGHVEVVSLWSHLANADLVGHPSIDDQLAAYGTALEVAARYGFGAPLTHLANSPAMLTRPDTHFDVVRVGLACYGLSPIEGQSYGLRPAMTVRARVALTKRVPAGTGVSYGHTHRTSKATTLALIPIGYGDGVPRAASNRAQVAIKGRRYPLVGRVCMDQFVVDIGDDPVSAGDEAILFGPGTGGEPTADDWAASTGTINYEIVTRMGSDRTPRIYDGLRP
jgi:alanine racemase